MFLRSESTRKHWYGILAGPCPGVEQDGLGQDGGQGVLRAEEHSQRSWLWVLWVPKLSLAMPPAGAGRSWAGKSPGAILPQSHDREKEQLHHIPLLLCRGRLVCYPASLCSKLQPQLLPFLFLALIWRGFSPWAQILVQFLPCSQQSHPLSPPYPVAKLPVPGLSHHQQGRATAPGLLSSLVFAHCLPCQHGVDIWGVGRG